MLTEAEFEELVALSIPNENTASRFYRHNREQFAEIERLAEKCDEITRLRAALAKAEAERDALLSRLAPSLEYVEGVACGYGDDEIDRLTARLDSERARADRYLAAMRSLMEGPLNQNRFAGWDAIRALVEEVKRG